MFKALPHSQFRRAVVVCSDISDREEAIDYMYGKFYRTEDLDEAKSIALGLNRSEILCLNTSSQRYPRPQQTPTGPPTRTLTFVSVFSCYTVHLKKLVHSLLQDIKTLTGTDKIIFANEKNPNTASL